MKLVITIAASTLTVAAAVMFAQAPSPVVIDGDFSDWAAVPVAVSDAGDAAQSAVDIGEVRVLSTARHLFLSIATGRSVNLGTMPGMLAVIVDRDGDATTGETVHGLEGVDVSVECSPLPTNPGVVVRRLPVEAGRPATETWSAVNFTYAPRHAGERFEMKLDQGAGTKARLKIVFVSGGKLIDETAIIPIAVPARAIEKPVTAGTGPTDPLVRDSRTSFRVAVWNVGGMLPVTADSIDRVIRAIDPDVLILDELWPALTAEGIKARLPSSGRASSAPWAVALGSRGAERGAVAARGRVETVMSYVPYPPEGLDAMHGNDAGDRIWTADDGIGAAVVVVRLGSRRLIVVPVDLTCCGPPESGNEALRILEADAINAATRRTLRGGADGVLVGGDFNLVGTGTPLNVMAHRLDLDNTALDPVDALRLNGLSKDTWRQRGGGGRFPPGRLDWLLHSGSTLEVIRSFVFDTADLSPSWLTFHKLKADDSAAASDHLPIVADFRWRR